MAKPLFQKKRVVCYCTRILLFSNFPSIQNNSYYLLLLFLLNQNREQKEEAVNYRIVLCKTSNSFQIATKIVPHVKKILTPKLNSPGSFHQESSQKELWLGPLWLKMECIAHFDSPATWYHLWINASPACHASWTPTQKNPSSCAYLISLTKYSAILPYTLTVSVRFTTVCLCSSRDHSS